MKSDQCLSVVMNFSFIKMLVNYNLQIDVSDGLKICWRVIDGQSNLSKQVQSIVHTGNGKVALQPTGAPQESTETEL